MIAILIMYKVPMNLAVPFGLLGDLVLAYLLAKAIGG